MLEQLGDLHRVERRALEQLIARDPKGETVLVRAIDPQSSGLAIIFPGSIERHRVTIRLRVIDEVEARR